MINITLRNAGSKTEAHTYFENDQDSDEIVRQARSGAEAASLIIAYVRKKYGRGIRYQVDGTPIRGQT